VEWIPTSRQVARADVSYMDGLKTIDGIDISSKRKRREYMKMANVVDTSDFSPEYMEGRKKAQEREDNSHRREVIEKAWWKHVEKGERR
jgi:hypothetical protein